MARRPATTLLLIGALLLTVALVVVDGLRFPGAPGPTVPAPVTLQALLEQGSQERHTVYAVLRTEAPGAHIVLDTAGDEPGLDPTSLRVLGGAGRIDLLPIGDGPLGADWFPDGEPDALGRLRLDAWELHREPGPIDTVLVGSRDGRMVLVDRRSVPELGLPAAAVGDPLPPAPSLMRTVAIETGLLVGLLLLGGLVLPRRVGGGILRAALALLAGAAVQATSAFLFLGGRVALLGGVGIALLVGRSLRRRGVVVGWDRADLGVLGASVMVLGAAALVARMQGLVIVSVDAIAHVERAIAMGAGTMGLADLDEKRPLALAAIHAPAHALGVEGLHALGWALLLAAVVVLAALPFRLVRTEDRAGRVAARVAGGLVSVLVVSVPMLRTMAAFLNTHLLVAVLLLLLVVLWALDDDGAGPAGLQSIAAIALLALIPARTESVLLVGLVLLATLATRGDTPVWPWAWPVVGAGLTAWNGLHVVAALDAGTAPSFPVTALTVVGIVTLLAGPIVHRTPPVARRAVAITGMASLWIVLIALLASTVGSGAGAVDGLRVNLGQGEGAWGVLAPLFVVLAAVALFVGTAEPGARLLLMRWLVVGAVPSVLLAKAADGTEGVTAGGVASALDTMLVLGARVGSWGDSANRMWSHFVLVAMALVVTTHVLALRDESDADAPRTSVEDRPLDARMVAAALAGGLVLLVALGTWQPSYLGPASPGSTIVVVAASDADALVAGPELIEGVRTVAQVTLLRVALPDDAADVVVCAAFRTTDLGRIVTGMTRVGLSGPSGTSTRTFDEFAWSGERVDEVCVPDPGVGAMATTLTVLAEGGERASAGDAAVLLARPGAVPAEAIEVRYVAASEDPRGAPVRLASRALRWGIESGPVLVTLLLASGTALLRSRPLRR